MQLSNKDDLRGYLVKLSGIFEAGGAEQLSRLLAGAASQAWGMDTGKQAIAQVCAVYSPQQGDGAVVLSFQKV